MTAPDPRVVSQMEQAMRMLSGTCPHTESYRTKHDCLTCLAEASYTAILTFVARENTK